MAHVENIFIYPVKGLDATRVETARLTRAGTLSGDREYAMVDPDATVDGEFDTVGRTFNGKEIEHLHEITSTFDASRGVLEIDCAGAEPVRFDLATELDAASEWFSAFADRALRLCHRDPPGFLDRPHLGPSVVSTGTLEEIASWFDGMTLEGARARFRPNVEIGGVPAFWEDRFLADCAGFSIDGVRFEGVEACVRCVVPSRSPDTGERTADFRRRLIERRRETLPPWVDEDALGSPFSAMLITEVPEASRDGTIGVGDEVRAGERPDT